MDNPLGKKIIAVVAIIFILYLAYYGSFLPLRKSQVFIETLKKLQTIRSYEEFEKAFSVPLNMPSPIGQEELVRNTSNIVLNLLQRGGGNPELVVALVDFLERYYNPILERGRGMSFEQNLYVLGAINELAFFQTNQVKYLLAAENHYSRGLELAPRRPQFLYGMFDIYRIEGNVLKAKAIAEQILEYWPNDSRTREALADFLAKSQAPPPEKK
jgi:hypothetical protein